MLTYLLQQKTHSRSAVAYWWFVVYKKLLKALRKIWALFAILPKKKKKIPDYQFKHNLNEKESLNSKFESSISRSHFWSHAFK